MPSPQNFAGLPNVMPFELAIDQEIGAFRQVQSSDVEEVLRRAYQEGNLFGTPLADDELGSPYARDFIDFVERSSLRGRQTLRILEVGAGTGFISLQLARRGHLVTSIEPGSSYKPYWDHYGIEVLNTCFPTEKAPGPFDVIIVSACVPKVPHSLKSQLVLGGRLVIPVGKADEQRLLCLTRMGKTEFQEKFLGAVRFVKLIGAKGWKGPDEPHTH